MSYGAASLLLEALGRLMSKTRVYYTVQEEAQKVPRMRRERVMERVRVLALGSDGTSVKGKGNREGVGEDAGAIFEGLAASGGGKARVAYQMRWPLLDRWNRWGRWTRYRSWKGGKDEQIDGTNHAAERAIG